MRGKHIYFNSIIFVYNVVMIQISHLREFPWAAIRIFLPAFISGTITSFQYGRVRSSNKELGLSC